jgi:hypothetical protein
MSTLRRASAWLALLSACATMGALGAALPSPDAIHVHRQVPLPAGVAVPRLSVDLVADSTDGFNLHLTVEDFAFGPPEFAGRAPEGVLEGHAHLYVNGEKVARLYGLHHHLPAKLLRKGVNQVTVTLNAHSHDTWTVDGKPFLATVFVDPTRAPPVVHRFSSSPTTK